MSRMSAGCSESLRSITDLVAPPWSSYLPVSADIGRIGSVLPEWVTEKRSSGPQANLVAPSDVSVWKGPALALGFLGFMDAPSPVRSRPLSSKPGEGPHQGCS